MKIKIKQTFRSMWATILAVLMLLSTFSAVAVTLNKDETGADIDIESSGYSLSANCVFFDNSKTQWSTVYLLIYQNSTNYSYELTNISGTDIWYRQSNWDNYTGFFFTDSNSTSNFTNKTSNLTVNVSSATLFSPQSATGTSISVSSSTTFNVTREAAIKVDNTGSGTYTTLNSDIPGTITISGKSISGTTLTSQTDTSSSTDADVSVSVSQGTNATLTYTPTNPDYEFVGWSTDSTEGNKVSDNTTYTYKVTNGATKYYALVKKSTSNPCVFPAGSSLYFDFGKCTGNTDGANLLANGTSSSYIDYNNSTYVSNSGESYFNGFNTGVVEVVLANDYTVTADTFLFKCGKGGWNAVKVSALPTEGQNMIIVNADGKGYTWGTYGATSPVATALSVSVTSSSPYYVNEPITLDKTVTLTEGVNEENVTYSYEYSTDNSNWTTIPDNASTYTPTSAGTYYFRVKASASGYKDFTSPAISVAVSLRPVATSLTVEANRTSCFVNDTITLNNKATLSTDVTDPTFTYQVKKDSGNWENLTGITYTPTSAGTYTFQVIASKDGYEPVTSNNTVSVTVTVKPSVAQSVTLTGASTALQGDTVTYTADVTGEASGANLLYEFFVNDTSVQGPSALSTLNYTHSTTGNFDVKVVVTSATGDYLPIEKTVRTTVSAPDEYYIEGRFKVRATENATDFTYVNNSNGDWKTNSTAIKFAYSNGKYYLNTYCSPKELSDSIGGNTPFFRIAKKSGTTFTEYRPSSDTAITSIDSTVSFTSTNNRSAYFNMSSTEGKVVLYWDPTTKVLSYALTGLEKYTIACGTSDHGTVTANVPEATKGTEIQLTVTPDPGYKLASLEVKKADDNTVTVDYNSTTKTFTMPEYNVTVYATFSLEDYTMTGVANPSNIGGSVTPSVPTANMGATVTFTANTVNGYSVDSWTVTGVSVGNYTVDGNTVTVTVETSNVTATANYVGDSYNVTQNASSNGTYTVTGVTAGKAQYGSTVIINPAPATGFALDSITVNKTGDTTTTVPVTNNSFTMPAYNVTITVKFRSNPGTSTQYKFLYSRSDNPVNMTAITGTVYENPTGTYTLTITDPVVISAFTATGGNSYFALSTSSSYTDMFRSSVSKTVSTETQDYISSNSIGEQEYGGRRFARVSFINQSEIKKLVLIYTDSATSPTYTVNAYAQSIETKSLADGVTLSANPTTQTIGKNVTLTATLGTVHEEIPDGAEFTYTFKCGSNVLKGVTGKKEGEGPYGATCTVTSESAGTQSYTVTVSTKESTIENYTPTDYESVTSEAVRVTYSDVVYYYAAVDPDSGNVYTREAIPENNMVSRTVSDGGTYYFSVFDNDNDTSPESVADFKVDSANNRYCTITKSSTETGLDYFIVKCNAKCSNPVIYFNKANKTVYAIATQNVGSSKTLDNSEKTVTYYFAEERYDSASQSNPEAGGSGMRIKYWNNSVDNSAYADVTTPVNVSGVDVDGKSTNCNSIFVRVDKFAGISSTDIPSTWNNHLQREFYIYSVELPIWATSFNFVSSSNTALTVDNTSQTGNPSCSSIVLNPNRVYCLFHNGTKNFVRGVVLDESMWNNVTRGDIQSNEVATQGFASNIVNYNTKKDDRGTTGNSTANNELTTQYGSDYQHPLYFNGWYDDNITNDTRTLYGSSYFRLHDNLAMRYNTSSYFASIQNLTDNRLSTTKKNKMGNGYLLGYNGSLMPEFNYEMLKTNSSLVYNNQLYENVQFPFYASTFDGVTTYSYDSTTDRNRVVDTTDGVTVKVSEDFVKNGSSYGYFPFGGTGDYDTYGCGTEFDINFYMTNNGKLSNGDDIAFNFSGDDDVWVYVDGVRVLDLGGAHSVSSGTINFSDMMVYYKTAANATDNVKSCTEDWSVDSNYVKTVSLTDLFEANGATFSNTDASTQHTLQMFYLERGEGESNCSISFNLPQNTGFRVNSNVTTNNVNEALVQDTMASANKDYFNYQIASKLASDDEYSNITAKFPNAHTPATNAEELTKTLLPNYPINSLLISREFLGSQYFLTATGATTSSSDNKWMTDNQWLNSKNNGLFTTLKNVNYTLSDAYAVKATSDDETSPSGRVSESGIFNLLFGQSALFESKIPNNTMIQLSQDDKISKVNAGVENSSVITAGDDSTKKVSDYYSSSYSIIDDNTGLDLANETKSVTDGKLYANDASANSNMFYFANYSGDATASSNAMTVTYTNDVLTSQIKLAKSVQNPSATDNFYFKVEFSKIFGEDLATAKEYPDLQYKVYNSDKTLFATRTYGKAGVYFTANQYAIIEGVPVDSAYKVVEKDRAGYKFDSASKTTYKGDTAGDPVPFAKNSVDGKTVSGAGGTTTYDAITFKNKKELFTVNFKYYDRSVITGTTSHISTSPTTVTYSYADVSKYTTTDLETGLSKYKLEDLVADAYAYYKFDNVIDTYKIFTSQSAAKDSNTGAGSLKVLREDIDGVISGETPYSTAYPSADLGLHYDCYGRPQGTADCKVTDGEDWVTYYNGSTKLSQADASVYGAKVTSITVWLYNTLKEYRPTFYYAPESATSSQLTTVEGTAGRYVATTNKSFTISKDVYYNVRLGGVNGNAQNDAATDYLKEYGITEGYCKEIADISSSVTYDGNNLKFLYWASDPKGKNILSTDIGYGYRVTNNLKAYAVYGKTDLSDKGLTIIPNTPDYYSNSNGKALVRLNNVMNVYNCPERDKNIKNASIIYIIDYSKADTNGITQMDKLIEAGGFDELQAKVREVLKENEASRSFVDGEDIVIEAEKITFTKNPTGDIDITGFNHKVVPYNEELNPGTDDIKLTNKNRVQFTTSFTKSNVAELKMYAMLGMNYAEVVQGKNTETNSWIVSDNLLYYAFDANGNVSIIKDPISDYPFYPTVPSAP